MSFLSKILISKMSLSTSCGSIIKHCVHSPSTSTPATADKKDKDRWSTAEYAFKWKFVLRRSLILRRCIRASLTE